MAVREIYTSFLGNHKAIRMAKLKLVDITVKSGNKAFAPTWDLLKRYKDGEVDDKQYRKEYMELMKISMKENRQEWIDLLQDKEDICLCCYCGRGKFCHRHLLVEILDNISGTHGLNFKFCGEM